ncbi:hypothetical protein HNY73_013116 [Argiope bruennichi]|uniref:Uncharacterized protein n=1 Tax=Argiope bruennichi TaxID=94029 RepID=A0A8T0F2X5_ARGBR|nr:hypothetical protein HNY73_013116 [Argiope bruennichi]
MNKILILLLTGMAIVVADDCRHFCDNVTCAPVTCSSNEKYAEMGTYCGCCPSCKKILKKGGDCLPLLFHDGAPKKVICDEGLTCTFNWKTGNTATCE